MAHPRGHSSAWARLCPGAQAGGTGWSCQRKEGWKKKRKMCGRHRGERSWELSFIVTHAGVISDWRGTAGLEGNLCLEGQGAQGCEGRPDTAPRGLWCLQKEGHGRWRGPRGTETPGRDGDSSRGSPHWGQQPVEVTASTAELTAPTLGYPGEK